MNKGTEVGKGERTHERVSGGFEAISALDHCHLPCQSQTYGNFQVNISQMPLISQCFSCLLESDILQIPLQFCTFFMELTCFELQSFVCIPSYLTCSTVNSLKGRSVSYSPLHLLSKIEIEHRVGTHYYYY